MAVGGLIGQVDGERLLATARSGRLGNASQYRWMDEGTPNTPILRLQCKNGGEATASVPEDAMSVTADQRLIRP